MGQKKVTHPAIYTADNQPRIPVGDVSWSPARSEQYGSMDAYYSEYRRDSLVRNSIDALAYFSTTEGFDAVVDLVNPGDKTDEQIATELKKYSEFQDHIDEKNRVVNLDNVLSVGITKFKIYGWTGFEVVRDESKEIVQLLPRETERSNSGGGLGLIPLQNRETAVLEGFSYLGRNTKVFEANEIFWLVNNGLEHDFSGISDIEPIFDQLGTRRFIMNEAFKETAKALWSPFIVLKVDTGRATPGDARTMLNKISNQLKPGKPLIINQDIEWEVIDQKPAVDKLVSVLEAVDTDIIGNFLVPRFLLGREKQFNRATAFAEASLFLRGPISDIQNYVAKETEAQWYRLLTVEWFAKKGVAEKDIPVKVKHIWKPVSMNDWVEQAQTWVSLFQSGVANREMALEGIGFDPAQILKDEDERPEINAETTSVIHQIRDSGGIEYEVKTLRRGASKPLLTRNKKK